MNKSSYPNIIFEIFVVRKQTKTDSDAVFGGQRTLKSFKVKTLESWGRFGLNWKAEGQNVKYFTGFWLCLYPKLFKKRQIYVVIRSIFDIR